MGSLLGLAVKIRQSKINSRLVAGLMGQMNRRPDQASDDPSIIFFHDFLQNSLQKYFQFICLFLLKNTKSTEF